MGWAGLGWAGLGWAGLGWAGLGWAGLGWAGLGLTSLVTINYNRPFSALTTFVVISHTLPVVNRG